MPLRPVSNVVPLPCRTQLIEFGTAVARRLKPFSSATWIKFDTVIKFDRVCRATRQWHGSVSNVPLLPCRTQFIKYEMYILSVLFWLSCPWLRRFVSFEFGATELNSTFETTAVLLPCDFGSDSFEFDTEVALRLKRAWWIIIGNSYDPWKLLIKHKV